MTNPTLRTPWHLWGVGVLGILWYLIGLYDFSSTILRETTYTAYFSKEMHAFYDAMPWWAIIAWGGAEFSGITGGILLLRKSRFAVNALIAALIFIFVNSIYNFVIKNAEKALGEAAFYFEALVIVSTVSFLMYALRMRQTGIIR
ncbi:MAG: putative membrane protein YiaA [Parasphingorhabdus sp.]|jgi:uncharacterized membrane protein YiaA